MTYHKSLLFLFYGKLFERFAWYGTRAVFVIYLEETISHSRAAFINGLYAALASLAALLVGLLTTTIVRQKWAVVLGSILLALGYVAFPNRAELDYGTAANPGVYLALTLLVCGSGCFSANYNALVASLCEDRPVFREVVFTKLYKYVNIGSATGITVAALLAPTTSYQLVFEVCCIVMLLSLAFTVLFLRHPDGPNETIRRPTPESERATTQALSAAHPKPNVTRDRVIVIMAVTICAAVFWTGFDQKSGSINLAVKNTKIDILGYSISSILFQAVNPVLVILLAPFFVQLWRRLERSGVYLGPCSKQAFGLTLLGLGFSFLAFTGSYDPETAIAPCWILAAYLFLTAGELCLEPIGQALVSRLAPRGWTPFMMAFWDASGVVAFLMGGIVPGLFGPGLWNAMAGIPLLAGIMLFALAPRLQRMMHDDRRPDTEERPVNNTIAVKEPDSFPAVCSVRASD